jgi:hypothetical protein
LGSKRPSNNLLQTNASISKINIKHSRKKSKDKWFGHARILSNEKRNGPSDRTELLSPKERPVTKKKAIK